MHDVCVFVSHLQSRIRQIKRQQLRTSRRLLRRMVRHASFLVTAHVCCQQPLLLVGTEVLGNQERRSEYDAYMQEARLANSMRQGGMPSTESMWAAFYEQAHWRDPFDMFAVRVMGLKPVLVV